MKKLLGIMVLGLLLSSNAYAELNKIQDEKFEWYNKQIDKLNKFYDATFPPPDDVKNDCRNSMGVGLWTDLENCFYEHLQISFMETIGNRYQRLLDINHKYYRKRFRYAEKISRLQIAGYTPDLESLKIFYDRNYDQYHRELEIVFEKIILAEQAKLNMEKEGEKSTTQSGSGFFINSDGYFVTNYHVVAECNDQSKISFKEYDVKAKLIAKDLTLDLALLKANVKPKDYLKISTERIKKRQKIIVAGYPFGKGLSDDLKFSEGIISSLKGYGDNSNEIQTDAAINPGNSGGPIVNQKGELVAVAVSGLAKDKSEGIGFGIKASSVINFLDINSVKFSDANTTNFSFGNKNINKLLENSTVYTFCN